MRVFCQRCKKHIKEVGALRRSNILNTSCTVHMLCKKCRIEVNLDLFK